MSAPESKPLPLKVRLPYGSEGEFIAKYGRNMGRGGIFVATRSPKPEGTPLAFELVLADGTRVLKGEGVVVRTVAGDGAGLKGMTVQFKRLDGPGRALLDRVLAQRGGGATPSPLTPTPDAAPLDITESAGTPFPADSAERGGVMGVELGSRWARAAVHGGGTLSLPSALALEGERVAVAAPAALERGEPSLLTGLGALLGQRPGDAALGGLSRYGPATLEAARGGTLALAWGNGRYTVEELVSVVLTALRRAVEERLGGPVRQAVFTVPGAFHSVQRRALKDAATRAGLSTLGFVQQASAAARAFAHQRGLARKRLLLAHLDGWTFDAGVVEVTGEETEPVWSQSEVVPPPEARGLAPDAGQGERVILCLDRMLAGLNAQGLSPDKMDGVILTGDLSAEALRPRVQAKIGQRAADLQDAPFALARGAALLGQARLTDGALGRQRGELLGAAVECVVTPGGATRVFEPRTRLPAEKTITVAMGGPDPVELAVFEGEPSHWSYLGLARITAKAEGAAELTARADPDGLLEFSVRCPGEQQPRPLELSRLELPSSVPLPPGELPAERPSGLLRQLKKLFNR